MEPHAALPELGLSVDNHTCDHHHHSALPRRGLRATQKCNTTEIHITTKYTSKQEMATSLLSMQGSRHDAQGPHHQDRHTRVKIWRCLAFTTLNTAFNKKYMPPQSFRAHHHLPWQ
jgi:hypothetical protein